MLLAYKRFLGVFVMLAACSSNLQAAVALASPFTNHAVLQRGQPIPVWGTADIGEQVVVSLDGQTKTVTAGPDRAWMIKLDSRPAGGPYELTVVGTNTITLTDVLVGEVWVCSGQSNMEWVVKNANNPDTEIAAANYPMLRHFRVDRKVSDEPLRACGGYWTVCTPESVPEYTAVGYFFARKLHKELNVPIGLLHASWGGTPAVAWVSRPSLIETATYKNVFAEWDKHALGYPTKAEDYQKAMATWATDAASAKAAGLPQPKRPRPPQDPITSPRKPAVLFNGMVSPLFPYGIKGAIWYQGESNTNHAHEYRELLSLLIADWRKNFLQGDFSFYIVQLANHMMRRPDPEDSNWAELREAQFLTATTVNNAGLAVAIDIGEEKDIHPKNKQDVGLRLALNALAKDYGRQIEYSGPVYKSMRVDGANAELTFDHLGGGLVAKGEKLTGFAIAGENKKFVWAEAKIVGDAVVVSAAGVAKPVAVRYAWADNPECSLYNQAGLPAVPFRTDRP